MAGPMETELVDALIKSIHLLVRSLTEGEGSEVTKDGVALGVPDRPLERSEVEHARLVLEIHLEHKLRRSLALRRQWT